jgi:hypothetical protein
MLGADLSTAAVVFLTSQCWDAPLAQKMHTKLALELPAGKTTNAPQTASHFSPFI